MIRPLGAVMAMVCVLVTAQAGRAQQKSAVAFEAGASALVAREIAQPALRDPLHEQQQEHQQEVKPEDDMGTSGFFLGIIGMLAGAAVGSQIGQYSCPPEVEDKDCMGRHAYTGALIAGTILTPLGVHIANKHPKHLPMTMGASALTGAVLYYGFKAIPGSPIAMAPFLAAPLQVFLSIKLEQKK